MQLIYNGTDLALLGVLRILSHGVQREPVESPQRERVTYKVRLDFFEQAFSANFGHITALRAALKTQNAVLTWTDPDGTQYLNRTVSAAADDSQDGLEKGGTYHQSVTFTFWFYNHDVVTNCLNATYQRTGPNTPLLTLSTVMKWTERLTSARYDELHDQRRHVAGHVEASGRIQADTTQPLASRQSALLALKDQLLSELRQATDGTLQFGTFNQVVRVDKFTAEIDQPANYIAWQFQFSFTRYPDEADYFLLDYTLDARLNQVEGVTYLTLAGKIQAATLAAASARLATLQASVIPATYVSLDFKTTPRTVGSESDNAGDGETFTELSFTVEYRDPGSILCTYQRTVANAPVAALGTVDGFTSRFAVTLFDEMRPHRKRAAGTVSLTGKWYAAESLSAAAKQAVLLAQLAVLETEMLKGSDGTLIYQTVIDQVVRLVDFSAKINRLTNCIEWSLTANYTAFPNESDYALCELSLETRQDNAGGTILKTLTGRIGAPTATAAQSKLARLRAALIPAGYTLLADNTTEQRVDVESDLQTTGINQGDGYTFVALTVADQWQLTAGNILTWTLRTSNAADARSGWVLTTYAGTVSAVASTQPLAFAAAAAQAQTLGGGKFPFLLRSNITSTDKLFQTVATGGLIFVTVEFSFEYQTKNSRSYLEVLSELNADSYGMTTQTISGYVVAPTLAAAQVLYTTQVRNAVAPNGSLVLSERTPTLMQQQLYNGTTQVAAFDDRYSFSLQLFQSKGSSQSAIQYALEQDADFQANETTTTVRGTVWAANQTAASALLATIITAVAPDGVLVKSTATPRFKSGPATGGTATSAPVFDAMDFVNTYVGALAGVAGILESEIKESYVYSGPRLIEKPIPDGISIIQQVGTTCGQHTVSAHCVSTTPSAAQVWVRSIRTALLISQGAQGAGPQAGAYEQPPRIQQGYQFYPQIAGVPVGDGVNVRLYQVDADFGELVPELVFS